MKIRSIAAGILFILSSCIKETVDTPDFGVTTEKSSYKVGEPVLFLFKGDAKQLSFYSGETGSNYAYKDGRVLQGEGMQISFATTVANGTQANQLSLLYSTDFNGVYDSANIVNATWTDITNSFTLATNSSETPSGILDASGLVKAQQPIYFAFRYITKPQNENGKQRNWYVREFLAQILTAEGWKDLATQASPGFHLISMGDKESGRTGLTSTQIQFRGNGTNLDAYTEDWALTARLDPSEINLGADWSIPIKGYSDFRQDTLTYTYQTAGKFVATFLARNATIYGDKSVIKEVPVTITEE